MTRFIALTSPIVPLRANNSKPGAQRARHHSALLWGLLWLLFCPSLLAAPELRLDANQNKLSLIHYSDILIDEFANWQYEEVTSPPLTDRFRPAESSDLKLKQGVRRVWFRFLLLNPEEEATHRTLEVSPANLGQMVVYGAGHEIAHLPSEQLIRKRALYKLYIPAQSSLKVLLRLDLQHSGQIALQLYDDATLLGESDRQIFLGALMVGALLFAFGYCALGGIVYRDTLFGWHGLFCALLIAHSVIAFDFIGEAQGLSAPWDEVLLMLIRLGAANCLLIFALRYPIYPKASSRSWKLTFQALITINFCAMAIAIIAGAAATPLNVALALTGTAIVGSAAADFFVTYRREVFFYLCVMLIAYACFAIAEVSHLLSLTESYWRNMSVASTGILVAVNHSAMLTSRARARRQRRVDEAQRIAVLGEVNRAKSDVLARITHDIRTPMSAMLGVTELLQETRLNASQKDYLRTLQRSCHELIQLLEESGQAARFNDADVELNSKVFSLPELVSDTLSAFRNMAAERELELICDIDPLMGDQLLGDPSRIRQLLTHGLNSAFEHCDDGYILLRIFPASSRPGHIQIDLSHRGKAFSRDERQALGKFGLDDSQAAVNARFAIIARLVQLMSGQVAIKSTGQTHTLSMTLEIGSPEGISHKPTDNTLLRDKRLLLADSNQTFCDVISKQCSTWGMSAFSAHNEQAALALMRNQKLIAAHIDFVLIDHRFAENGLQLCRRIRDEFSDKAPTILLLAHANISYSRDQLQQAGVSRVLSKPLGNIALRSALLGESHYAASQRDRHLDQYGSDSLSLPSLHCLIAEDNPTNALVLVRMLSGLGITVKHVENGQQAVNNFMRGNYDIVILDIEMPVMDGVEATREIRRFEEEEERERTPIFGLTANALDEQRDRYLQAGMDLHLVKPVRLWELAESIQRWTGYRKRPDDN